MYLEQRGLSFGNYSPRHQCEVEEATPRGPVTCLRVTDMLMGSNCQGIAQSRIEALRIARL